MTDSLVWLDHQLWRTESAGCIVCADNYESSGRTLRRIGQQSRRQFRCLTCGSLDRMQYGMQESDAREEAQDIYDAELRRPPPPQDPRCDLDPCNTREDMEDAIDRANKWRTGGLISYGVATAALGASIYFFIKERPAQREGFELPMAVVPIPDGDGGIAGVGATYTTTIDW